MGLFDWDTRKELEKARACKDRGDSTGARNHYSKAILYAGSATSSYRPSEIEKEARKVGYDDDSDGLSGLGGLIATWM